MNARGTQRERSRSNLYHLSASGERARKSRRAAAANRKHVCPKIHASSSGQRVDRFISKQFQRTSRGNCHAVAVGNGVSAANGKRPFVDICRARARIRTSERERSRA